jgi:HK97 family phage portal protein
MIQFLLPSKAATVQTLGHPAAGVIGWMGGTGNTSGVEVTQSSALTFAAVWCAVRILSETVSTLPCMMYRRRSDGSREANTDDDRYWLISEQPHPDISAINFFDSRMSQLILQGDSFAEINYGGQEIKLEPRAYENVDVGVNGDSLEYHIIQPPKYVPNNKMLHVAGMGGDGLRGWSLIKYAAQSLGGGLAADQYAGGQWGNGATPSGVLTHPMRLDKPTREALRREWEDVHKGSSNAGKIAIMHGGMDFKPVSMSNEDAQFLESRQFTIRDVARWFRVPPHMLADLENSSVRANIEQEGINFIVYSLMPWLTRWEQTLNRKLLTKEERRSLYFEFNVEALLRGDSAARSTAWSIGRQWGWYSVNEIRRMMNLPPVEGGDVYLQPSNMVPADSDMARGEKPEAPQTLPNILDPQEDDEEDTDEMDGEVPESLSKDLRANLLESLASIVDSGKQLREDLEDSREILADSLVRLDYESREQIRGLREIREEIHRDINRVGQKVQAQGFDAARQTLIDACNKMLHSNLHTIMKIEKNKVAKAVKAAVNCGENFVAWLDEYYASYGDDVIAKIQDACDCFYAINDTPFERQCQGAIVSDALIASHKESLLAASDGDAEHFAERVQAALDSWDDELTTIELGA